MNATEQPGTTRGAASFSAPLLTDPACGELVERRFIVGGHLAHGPSGLICRATMRGNDRPLAIRFVRLAVDDERSRKRFHQSLQAAAELAGEHTVRVLGSGSLPSGVQYVVTEFLEGESLAELLEREGALTAVRAVGFTRQICEALMEAHATGLVHRDIKPQNLFITRSDGHELVKILDFGIPKQLIVHRGDPNERAADGAASLHYASPEQIATPAIVDARSDLWAVGVVLYEMLTGRRPFDGESPPEVFAKVLGERPAPIRSSRPDLDRGLEAVVLRCLAKDPAHRFQSSTALARALEPFAVDAAMPGRPDWSFSAGPIELPVKSRHSLMGILVLVASGGVLIAGGWLGARALEGKPEPHLNPAGTAAPFEVKERSFVPQLPLGAYGERAQDSLRAEPEVGLPPTIVRTSPKRPLDLDKNHDGIDGYDDVERRGMRSPSDIYILERRIYDSNGNLLDVQTRVLEGAPETKSSTSSEPEVTPEPVPIADAGTGDGAAPSSASDAQAAKASSK